jgi:peptide/nickel transport system substrate-binding protein
MRSLVAKSALFSAAVFAVACSRGHARPSSDGDAAIEPPPCGCPPAPAAARFDPNAARFTAAPSEKAMTVLLDAEPPSLMPFLRPDWLSWMVIGHLVQESLVRVDARRGVLVPELAEKWEVDETHTRWTFHLRHGVTWHDGVPFTADDVIFTFDRLLDPRVGAPDRVLFSGARVTKIGAFDVEVKLRTPLAAAELDFDRLLILSRHRSPRGDLAHSPDATAPVGTGPMRFGSWTRGARIELARSGAYWGTPAPVASLTFRFPPSHAALLATVDASDFDVVPRATSDMVERVERDQDLRARYSVIRAAGANYTAWIHNVASPKLRDPRVRRAIGLSIPRDVLRCEIERCNVGMAIGPLPPGHPALSGLSAPSFDPKAAAKELDAAGIVDHDADGRRELDGAPLVLRLIYPSSSHDHERSASVVADELRRIGVTLELAPLEWAQFLRQVQNHDFELAAIEWTIDSEPDLFPLFHSTQVAGSLNYGAYASPEVDGWLDELRQERPAARRAELLHEVVTRLRRDEPYTFLFSPLTMAIARRGTRAISPTPLGWEPRAWAWEP